MLELAAAPAAETNAACKGHYYRYLETAFIGKNGRLVVQKELRPLKSISCPGCGKCGALDDDLHESFTDSRGRFLEFDATLKAGDTAYLVLVEDGHDWETGHLDNWHYRVTRQQPTQDTTIDKEDTK